MRLTRQSTVLGLATGIFLAFGSAGFSQPLNGPLGPNTAGPNTTACAFGAGQSECLTAKPLAPKHEGRKSTGPASATHPGLHKGNGAQMPRSHPPKRHEQAARFHHRLPHIGEDARHAPRLQQARNSRLPALPHGQHYRVFDDRVVRVDDRTQKIVAIIGLTSQLLGR